MIACAGPPEHSHEETDITNTGSARYVISRASEAKSRRVLPSEGDIPGRAKVEGCAHPYQVDRRALGTSINRPWSLVDRPSEFSADRWWPHVLVSVAVDKPDKFTK